MQDPKNGAIKRCMLVDCVHKHKTLSPSCVETGELDGLKSFLSGKHAFVLGPDIGCAR